MSATLYDKALLEKIQKWVKDPNMTITGPEESNRLFSSIIDKSNDSPIELPLIALKRKSSMEILNVNRKPTTHDGWKTAYSMKGSYATQPESEFDKPRITQLNVIPIRLSYQLDIYTRHYEEAEEYVRDFIFKLINFPDVTITVPYNDCNMQQTAFIDLATDVEDNSDIPERLIAGQFTRKSISFSIDGNLYSYRTKDAAQISVDDTEVK